MTSSLVVLTEDLIAEILSFLPVKYLLRFRCVCKSWKTLISEPSFVKLHLEKSQSQTRNSSLFPMIIFYENPIPDSEEEYCVVRYHINRIFENYYFTIVDDPNYHHLNNKGSQRGSFMVGSCNGLILFYDKCDIYTGFKYWFRVWNPATRTSSQNFGFFHHRRTFKFAFGCDNSTGTYKVVASRSRYVRVLNLGGDNVWRNIESFPYRLIHAGNYVYLNGTLNWLAIHNNTFCYNTVEQFVIVSLDLGTETYNQYMLPNGFNEVLPNVPTISVLGGCLCFSYSYRETDFVIWQMKKFRVEDSWTQLLKISHHDLLIDCDFSCNSYRSLFQLVPLFLSGDGNFLILQSNLECQTILYNRRDNRTKRTKVVTIRTIADDFACDDEVRLDRAKDYVESLVPIF